MADKSISSPYLVVEHSGTMHDASAASTHSTMHDTATTHGLTAPPGSLEPTKLVPKERSLLIIHTISGIFAFLSFALMGGVAGINVQSGIVTTEDLLAASRCQDGGADIVGSTNFNPFRLCLVIGVLVWLYALATIFLATIKKCASTFLRPGQAESAQFSAVVLCIDAVFLVLTFLAFILGAVSIGAPFKIVYQGQEVFFNLETLLLTLTARGLCPANASPLPVMRGAVAMMFFCFCAMSTSCVASVQMYRSRLAVKSAGTSYVNCL